MCDTMVALGRATSDGRTILAKNSDREPNEAQILTHVPRQSHPAGATVRCTYLELPQATETFEVILSRPFWMWGAEMGANEHGVAIGNEAVFTREPYGKKPGLIGMDMVRLALERSDTARAALDLIIELLGSYGQSGNCGYRHPTYYHNSFLIADSGEAWCLETAGRFWAAQRVSDVGTISNGLTIGKNWDKASPGLVEHAVEKKWCKSATDFDFARCYSDLLYTRLDGCARRQCRSLDLLSSQAGHISVQTMWETLRDHGPGAADPGWNPGKGWMMDTLCVHASLGPTRPSQSTGSMVAHLDGEFPVFWLTGTSAPCTSVFKPVFLRGAGLPYVGPDAQGTFDDESMWWRHERLHRATLREYATRHSLYRAERDALETAWLDDVEKTRATLANHDPHDRRAELSALTARCFARARDAEERWLERVRTAQVRRSAPALFRLAWDRTNKAAGFPV
jgi:dipeptidase